VTQSVLIKPHECLECHLTSARDIPASPVAISTMIITMSRHPR